MTFQIDILTLLAFIGTFQGLVFALIFWVRNTHVANRIFAFLMLATSIRIAKNIFVHLQHLNPGMFISMDWWRTSIYLGLSHQFAIGPLFLMYFQAKLIPGFKIKVIHLIHFLPYLIMLGLSPFVEWGFWKYGGLLASYISILVYFLLAVWSYFKHRSKADDGTRRWLEVIIVLTTILIAVYSPALFHYVGYVGGGILYTVCILVTGYIMLTNKGGLSLFRSKYQTSSLREERVQEIVSFLKRSMEEEKLYLSPELTLQELADKAAIQSHHISRVINQEFKMNFTDYINQFRLREAEKMLVDEKNDHLKMSALAYSCGFNSIPTFNTLFKKVHKMTPSQYRINYKKS